MPTSHLPENVDDWPRNPSALLGVEPLCGADVLKRAYLRLIRIYKPEHAPAEFRLIREAYETLQRLQSYWKEEAPPTAPAREPDDIEDGAPILDNSRPATPGESVPLADLSRTWDASNWSPPTPPAKTAEDYWRQAIAGQWGEAYAGLTQLARSARHEFEVFAQLFWLLKLRPDLDEGRVACDWLEQGIITHCDIGRLAHLYGEELQTHPEEVRSNRCERIVRAIGLNPPGRELLVFRWESLGACDEFATLLAEFEDLSRAAESKGDDAIGLWLVEVAWSQSIWSIAPEAQRICGRCRELLPRWDHLQFEHEDIFWRLEQLHEISKGPLPPAVARLLRLTWGRPASHVCLMLDEFLRPLLAQADFGLAFFEGLGRINPAALCHLGLMFDTYLGAANVEALSGDATPRTLFVTLVPHAGVEYAQLRPRLLEFGVRELTALEWLFTDNGRPPLRLGSELHAFVEADLPLRMAVKGYLGYWLAIGRGGDEVSEPTLIDEADAP